jgi:ribose transport system ATP-binding protein
MKPDTYVASLSVGDRQLVEIAKALRRRPKLLILDEPTAAIGEHEVSLLMAILKRLRSEGMAILYVTHLLPEVFALADRVTVLRDGQVVLASPIGKIDEDSVVKAIAPQIRRMERSDRGASDVATPLLRVDDLQVAWVGPVSFSVARGEVVGLFGLLGSGRTEILEAIYGLRSRGAGDITLDGRPHDPRAPSDSLKRKVALVPSDRLRFGILGRLTSLDNVELPHVRRLSRRGIRRPGVEREEFRQVAQRLSLSPPNPDIRAWTFSGGNQQKLVVGRWLSPSASYDLLLLDEPTQGIDVGARADLYRLIRELAAKEQRAVLFTSSDPEETLALADRVAVLRRGRIVAEMPAREVDEERLLILAHGTGRAAETSPQQVTVS